MCYKQFAALPPGKTGTFGDLLWYSIHASPKQRQLGVMLWSLMLNVDPQDLIPFSCPQNSFPA